MSAQVEVIEDDQQRRRARHGLHQDNGRLERLVALSGSSLYSSRRLEAGSHHEPAGAGQLETRGEIEEVGEPRTVRCESGEAP